ncbi:MAG: hypothetical protein IPL32_08850 [Chloracidobacterium sp.]|nr:hypothetical protein [Chloracidobacterium sp.]
MLSTEKVTNITKTEKANLYSGKYVTTIKRLISSEMSHYLQILLLGGRSNMSEFEAEVKKAEQELEQGLVPIVNETEKVTDDEFLGDIKMQAQEYGQKLQDAAAKAKDFANDKFTAAGDKFKELQGKDPKELIEDAKEFARQKPGQTILISAAVGLVLGLLFRGGRK